LQELTGERTSPFLFRAGRAPEHFVIDELLSGARDEPMLFVMRSGEDGVGLRWLRQQPFAASEDGDGRGAVDGMARILHPPRRSPAAPFTADAHGDHAGNGRSGRFIS